MKKVEYFLKSILLKLLLLFNPIKKDALKLTLTSKSNLLFIRLNRIGDALVTTPLLHEIKNQTGCKIFVLTDIKNHFVFRNNTSIDEVIVFEKGLKGFFNFNKLIKERSIDAIIDLHDDVSTTVSFLIALAKVKYKIALRKSNYSIFTHTVEKLDPKSNHVIDRILNLGGLFDLSINKGSVSVRFCPTEDEIKKATSQIEILNPDKKYLIGINISAGSEARFWGVDNFRKVLNELLKYNVRTIIFCSEAEHHLAKQITEDKNIYPTTKDFGIFAAAIMKLDFLFTPDTSVVHIASINKIPVFGIYVKYKTDDMIWSPYNTDFEYVVTEEPTLKDISFEEVKNKLIPFLENHLNAKTNS